MIRSSNVTWQNSACTFLFCFHLSGWSSDWLHFEPQSSRKTNFCRCSWVLELIVVWRKCVTLFAFIPHSIVTVVWRGPPLMSLHYSVFMHFSLASQNIEYNKEAIFTTVNKLNFCLNIWIMFFVHRILSVSRETPWGSDHMIRRFSYCMFLL